MKAIPTLDCLLMPPDLLRLGSTLLGLFAILASAHSSQAQAPLPAASWGGFVLAETSPNSDETFIGSAGNYSAAAGGSSRAFASGSEIPSPSLSACTEAGGFESAQTLIDVNYYFEILGPTDQVDLFVQAAGSVLASGMGDGRASALFSVQNTTNGDVVVFDQATSNGLDSFAVDGDFAFETGVDYHVTLSVATLSEPNQLNMSNFDSGVVDPTFLIAPNTPDAQDYSIEFSPGIGDSASSVPDGGTTAYLFGGALAGLACLCRRLPR